MDFVEFQSPAFTAKAWVNKACQQCPEGEQLERYLPELEMKVQMAAEDTEQQLYESSTLILKRVQAAAAQLQQLQGDLVGLGDTVDGLATRIAVDERSCSSAVATLKELDAVRGRILAASRTLQEASRLKDLYDTLGEVLESNDMVRMMSALTTLKASMDALSKVPQFTGVADKVLALENRLKDMTVPKLEAAIKDRQGDAVKQYWDNLAEIDKLDLAQELYVRHVTVQLSQTYKQISSKGELRTWLPAWHKALLEFCSSEMKWLSAHLSDSSALFMQALSLSLKGLVKPLLGELAKLHQSPAALLSALTTSLTATTEVCQQLAALFPGVPRAVLSSLMHPLLEPFEGFMGNYAQLEATFFASELAKVSLGPASELENLPSADTGATVSALINAPATVQRCALAALKRCADFTCSLELPALIPVLDECLEGATRRAQSTLAAATASTSANPAESPLLRLPLVGKAWITAVAAIDADIRRRAGALGGLVSASRGGDVSAIADASRGVGPEAMVDVVVWRMSGSREAARLAALQDRLSHAQLPRAFKAVESLKGAAETALLDMLCQQPHRALAEVESLSDTWAQEASATELPNFNTYPSTFATAVGEYLITLPQMLEVLLPEGANSEAEGDSLASEWLDHTAAAIAKNLERYVLGIKRLGTQGSLQLTTDLEYVCNVIAALGVALPLPLSTAMSLTACQDEASFQDLVASGLADGSFDAQTCKVVAQMRSYELPTER